MIADAPYIRQAENDGMEDYEVECPVCERLCETIYETEDGDVVGCDRCIRARDAEEWKAEREDRWDNPAWEEEDLDADR